MGKNQVGHLTHVNIKPAPMSVSQAVVFMTMLTDEGKSLFLRELKAEDAQAVSVAYFESRGNDGAFYEVEDSDEK